MIQLPKMVGMNRLMMRKDPTVNITRFGGVDFSGDPTEIDIKRSPDMLNMQLDIQNNPVKRTGYKKVFTNALTGGTGINYLGFNPVANKFVIAYGTNLYTFLEGDTTPTQLYSGMTDNRTVSFFMNNKQYFLDGTNFIQWDGVTTPVTVESVAYIPTTVIGRLPTGGGTVFEAVNMLQPARKNSFVGKAGTYEVAQLQLTSIATANGDLTITLNGTATNVAILATDTINGMASKVRGTTFTGWTVGGNGDTITFTSTTTGAKTDATFNSNATGVLGTMTTPTQGTDAQTVFTLDATNLDATAVTATVAGVSKVETTDFTVDRVNGKATFNIAPPDGNGVDNVVITFYKTVSGYANKIKNCTVFALYGGTNDTRVFLSGNPSYKNMDWYSGTYDATYWPDTGYSKVGSDNEAIIAYKIQDDYLTIHKENSKWSRIFSIDSTGKITFPLKPVNDQIGLVSKDSLQLIENSPVGLTTKGIWALHNSNVRDQRNVQWLSNNLEPNLLNEANPQNAISIDFNNKYYLGINNKVYIMDYKLKYLNTANEVNYESYVWDNVPAKCFFSYNGYLYFGANNSGMVYRFKTTSEIQPYNDDGQAINAYWTSKVMSMDMDNYKKVIEKVTFNLNPLSARSSADLYYISDKKVSDVLKQARIVLFNFNDIDFSDFSFLTNSLPQPFTKRVKAKKVVYFQVILKNNRVDEGMSIETLIIKFVPQQEIK